ncbi:hypothetical protein IC582_008378 [Cucumis melo]|uniref:Ninja-family protein n=2 Tax=Cucumis melo TaxID=3656 RepID=A0A5D3DQY3_CUCMM|nr:ninja-family protein AFP2-like [Cucumis melo var. makuwa]TYK26063.1 ninja-family protein AFP2-like [Cucumis melo var. makuwa]
MKSMNLHQQNLDLRLSIGGPFNNLPEKLNGSDQESGVTDVNNRVDIRRRHGKRKREEDPNNNPPFKNRRGNFTNNVDLNKPDPPLQISYPYSSLQYVPFFNGYGYAYPCLVPYWPPDESPVGCRIVSDDGVSNKKSGSCGSSPVCSSSVVSDNHHHSSSSLEGGCSNSSNSSISMKHVKPKPCNKKFVEDESSQVKKSSSSSMENGKPPKPQIQTQNNVASFEQMPCVSTTGIGPNGTKIVTTGFLYRYSNLEVSILCVCHGRSFSPAEFVKHGGGGEVSHPLKHITVLPPNGFFPSSIR